VHQKEHSRNVHVETERGTRKGALFFFTAIIRVFASYSTKSNIRVSSKEHKGRMQIRLLIEGITALLIALTPLLTYMYKYIPKGDTTWSLLGLQFGTNGYDDVYTAMYFYLSKFVPLILMVIWFFTTKKWWYHAILIPMAMYGLQFYIATSETGRVDENEIMYLVVMCMVIVPVLYLIRIKLVDKYVHGIDLNAMDEEIQIYKEKEELRKEREQLELRKKTLSKKA